VFRLLHLISYPQLRSSWGRTLLVIGGIATGIALITAIDVINTSVLANFRRSLDIIAGPASLEVTLGIGEVGFDESVVETIQHDPDVTSAIPLVRGTVSLADDPKETLQLFGADLTEEHDLERYRVTLQSDRRDLLAWFHDPTSLLITAAFASQHGLGVGQQIALATPDGVQTLTVRGLLEPQGFARAYGGQLAVMDLPAAQALLAKTGRLDQVDVVVRDGAVVAGVEARLKAALPATLNVDRPAQRGELYEQILASFQALLTGFSLVCLVAGIYIIYNTTSTAAVHRAFVTALLRITGADAPQLFRLLMTEAIVLGVTGTLIGIPVGIGLGWLLIGMVSDSMGVIFQLRFPVQTIEIDYGRQAFVGVLGVAAAAFASYFAARRATSFAPLDVLRSDLRSLAARPNLTRLMLAWLMLVLVSAVGLAFEIHFKSIAWGNFGSTLWYASSMVIAIPMVSASASLLSRVLKFAGAEGQVAAESLFRSPTRTGVTVAAIALVLTLGITLSSLVLSLRNAAGSYYDDGGFLAGDVVVSAVATEGGWLETPLPIAIADELAAIPGVRSVETVRAIAGQLYRGQRISVLSVTDGFFDVTRYGPWFLEGEPAQAVPLLRAGEGATIAIGLADRFGLQVGDTIRLDTPTGTLAVPIVGVVRDYMSDRGTVTISRRLFTERWQDDLVSRFNVAVQPGALESVRQAIGERLGSRYRLKVLFSREMVDYHVAAIDRAFAFTDAIQLLIVIVTVAGIFDLLLAAIWERRRELSLWRVIGADEAAVRRSVVIESATIGGLGALLGSVVGLVTGWIWIRFNFRYLLGFTLDYHFAYGPAARYAALVMLMTFVAGYVAARQATRQPILSGIRTD
jgi:putative ABC transport system permease protein